MGNLNNTPVGKCSLCGGIVSIPRLWWGTQRPVPECERCHAVAAPPDMPVIPMVRGKAHEALRLDDEKI